MMRAGAVASGGHDARQRRDEEGEREADRDDDRGEPGPAARRHARRGLDVGRRR